MVVPTSWRPHDVLGPRAYSVAVPAQSIMSNVESAESKLNQRGSNLQMEHVAGTKQSLMFELGI